MPSFRAGHLRGKADTIMPAHVLLTPGPVNVSPRVRQALLRGDLCHREPEFGALLASVRRRLVEAARAEAGRLVEGARAEVEQDVRRARQELRQEVADLAVSAAERLIRKSLRGEEHKKIVTDAIAELERTR
jgi:hypothetical protein